MTAWEDSRTPAMARADAPALDERLEQIWGPKPGLLGWICSVDHKEIGLRYIVTAFGFLIIGGLEALVIRAQLAPPLSDR